MGISYRAKATASITTRTGPIVEDLDALPMVTEIYHRDLTMEHYEIPYLRYPYVSFYTGRGCPGHCVYCLWPQTFTGRRYRVRSVANVVAEVRRSLELFPQAAEIFFDDDTFTADGERARQLSREFRDLKFVWSATARANTSYETLKAMKEGGLRLLVVGFETGDPQVLKNIRKGVTLDLGRRLVKWCRELGIQVHGTFMVGLPGETQESIEASIRFACELDPDTIQVSLATPYPGTEFYDFCRDQGYLQDDALVNGATGYPAVRGGLSRPGRGRHLPGGAQILPPVLLPAPLHGPGGPGDDAGPGGAPPLAQGRPPVFELHVQAASVSGNPGGRGQALSMTGQGDSSA